MPVYVRENTWILETANTAYAFGLTPRGMQAHAYWGARLPWVDDYPDVADSPGWASFTDGDHITPEEYPAYAGAKYVEPCLKATFADGVRDVVLTFAGADAVEAPQPELRITLRDAHYPLDVVLHYRAHEAHDLIERWVEVTNRGDAPVTLERVWSALWHLPWGGDYRLSHLSGRWLDEWQLQAAPAGRQGHGEPAHYHQSPRSPGLPWTAVRPTRLRARSGLGCWHGAATGRSPPR